MLPGPGLYEAFFVCVCLHGKKFFSEILEDCLRIQANFCLRLCVHGKNFSGKFYEIVLEFRLILSIFVCALKNFFRENFVCLGIPGMKLVF